MTRMIFGNAIYAKERAVGTDALVMKMENIKTLSMKKRQLLLKWERRIEQLKCMQSIINKCKNKGMNFNSDIELIEEFINDLKTTK